MFRLTTTTVSQVRRQCMSTAAASLEGRQAVLLELISKRDKQHSYSLKQTTTTTTSSSSSAAPTAPAAASSALSAADANLSAASSAAKLKEMARVSLSSPSALLSLASQLTSREQADSFIRTLFDKWQREHLPFNPRKNSALIIEKCLDLGASDALLDVLSNQYRYKLSPSPLHLEKLMLQYMDSYLLDINDLTALDNMYKCFAIMVYYDMLPSSFAYSNLIVAGLYSGSVEGIRRSQVTLNEQNFMGIPTHFNTALAQAHTSIQDGKPYAALETLKSISQTLFANNNSSSPTPPHPPLYPEAYYIMDLWARTLVIETQRKTEGETAEVVGTSVTPTLEESKALQTLEDMVKSTSRQQQQPQPGNTQTVVDSGNTSTVADTTTSSSSELIVVGPKYWKKTQAEIVVDFVELIKEKPELLLKAKTILAHSKHRKLRAIFKKSE